MNTAVGKSKNRRSRDAGREAAREAVRGLTEEPRLLLVFATAGYDPVELLAGVREVAPAVRLAGCSAEGVITAEGSDEGSHAVTVAALGVPGLESAVLQVEGVAEDPGARGRELAAAAAASGVAQPRLLLVFPDGLAGSCTELLDALSADLDPSIVVAGGCAGDMLKFERTHQFAGDRVLSGAVVAVLLGGPFEVDVTVSHGCSPIGNERTVTRSDGTTVFEIDGRSAWKYFLDYLDRPEDEVADADITHLCLAQVLPGRVSEGYGDVLIRSPLGVLRESGALHFPGGVEEGARVRMALRDPERVSESAVRAARTLAARHPDRHPALVLHFDCAGRGQVLFGERTTELGIAPVQAAIGDGIPWLGFHTYGEIAPLNGRPRYHNYTVALCALYPERP